MKIIHKNKKATFDYEILETYKTGMILTGPEIKSIRMGHVNLKGAYIGLGKEGVLLKGANVSRYAYDSNDSYDPFRNRKLLLKKSEIDKISNVLNTQGVTIVPLEIGLEGKYAKLIIGIVRGKKKYDKRETIKTRESKRRLDRLVKKY